MELPKLFDNNRKASDIALYCIGRRSKRKMIRRGKLPLSVVAAAAGECNLSVSFSLGSIYYLKSRSQERFRNEVHPAVALSKYLPSQLAVSPPNALELAGQYLLPNYGKRLRAAADVGYCYN